MPSAPPGIRKLRPAVPAKPTKLRRSFDGTTRNKKNNLGPTLGTAKCRAPERCAIYLTPYLLVTEVHSVGDASFLPISIPAQGHQLAPQRTHPFPRVVGHLGSLAFRGCPRVRGFGARVAPGRFGGTYG